MESTMICFVVLLVTTCVLIAPVTAQATEATTPAAPVTTTPAPDTTPAPVCTEHYKADVYGFLDNSGSINVVGHGRELSFVNSVIRDFELGPNSVQIGMAQFSNDLDPRIEFNTSYDADVLTAIVNSSQKTTGGTFTAKALNKGIDEHHVTGNGRRNDVPLIVILITDGRSDNTTNAIAAAERYRNQLNATIIVITVGSVQDNEIVGLAGDTSNIFGIKSLAALESIKPKILLRVCQAASNPRTTAAPTTTTAEPETTTPEPETTTPEPETTTPEPECITPEPETTTTPEPETTTTPEPETTTTPEPETTTTPEPETTTTPEPETTTTPEPETTTTREPDTTTAAPVIPVTPCPANKGLDIIFVVDSSDSIGALNFEYNRLLCRNIAYGLIGVGRVRIAIIIYGTHAYKISGLSGNILDIETAIAKMPYRRSTTQTDAGIKLADYIFETEGYADSQKVIIVITDGASTNTTATCEEADKAKAKGTNIIAVAVGINVNYKEIKAISSTGKYFNPSNYNELPKIANELAKSACDAAQLPLPGVRIGVRVGGKIGTSVPATRQGLGLRLGTGLGLGLGTGLGLRLGAGLG